MGKRKYNVEWAEKGEKDLELFILTDNKCSLYGVQLKPLEPLVQV